MKRLLVLLSTMLAMAVAAVKAYEVVPYRNYLGVVEDGQVGVAQYFRMCVDSLTRVSLWVADPDTHRFFVSIVDSASPLTRVAYGDTVAETRQCCWLTFDLACDEPSIKGRTYKAVFTRSGGAEIEYAYNPLDPYKYGQIAVSGGESPPPEPLTADLAMRVEGSMRPVEKSYFGVDDWNFVKWSDPDADNRHRLRREAGEIAADGGVGSMMLYARWPMLAVAAESTRCSWNDFDAHLWNATQDAQCRPVIDIQGVAKAASSREAMVWTGAWVPDTAHYGDSIWQGWMVFDTAVYCAPRGLWEPLYSDSNFWSNYIRDLVMHPEGDPTRRPWPGQSKPCDRVHAWEIWNEPNDTCVNSMHYITDFTTGWWRRPNVAYAGLGDGLRGLCSLYLRLAEVSAAVIRDQPGHDTDLVLIASTHRVLTDPNWELAPGIRFIRDCYEIATQLGGPGVFWDGVSIHPYQSDYGFDPVEFEMQAESVRAVARHYGDYDCQVWCSETGLLWYSRWDRDTIEQYYQGDASRYFPQLYSTALASQALPGARYDQCQWWWYSTTWNIDYYGMIGLRDIDDSDSTDTGGWWQKLDSYYAFRDMAELLTGQQFERRVMTDDVAQDDSVRLYEFTDPETQRRRWVAWAVDPRGSHGPNGRPSPVVDVRVPARTDRVLLGTTHAYQPPPGQALHADPDGWLRLSVGTGATYLTEDTTPPSRSDLVVDSVRVRPLVLQVGRPCTLYAFVHDHGKRQLDLSTRVRFAWNDDTLPGALNLPWDTLHDETHIFAETLAAVPAWMHGTGLLSAEVNPGQQFVELGMDDNAGYLKTRIFRIPEGTLSVPSGSGRSNLPVIGLQLASASWETDTTGQTPADSFRLRQVHYAFGDSIPDDSVTSAWAAFRPDTVVALAFGAGRYRIEAQYKDGAENASVWVQDTTFDLLAFDAAAPVGSLDLNSGARFATVPACTVRVSGSDAGAGLATLRLSHSPGANLLDNPAFDSDASWAMTGGAACDETLGLAVLPVASGAVAAVSQPVAAARLSPLIGDSCRLCCDLLVSVDSACSTAVGSISLFYRYRYLPDTLQPDSLLPVASVSFAGGLRALCANSPLGADFLLPAPGSGAQWQWQGGLVKLGTFGVAGLSGTAWADNLRLAPCGPAADYGWDAPFDSLSLWTIAGSPGPHAVWGLVCDSCGNESAVFGDTVVLDTTPPTADIYQPLSGSKVNKTVKLTGLGFDPVEVAGDTWFLCYRLDYRHKDSTEYLPVVPDSVSYAPCYAAGPGLPGGLGAWNSALVADGEYYLRLTVCDSAGHQSEDETWVSVRNGLFPPKSQTDGPAGAVSLDAEGADYTGSAQGRIVRIGEDLDSLAGFVFADSGTPAYVAAVIDLDSGHLLCADLRTGDLSRLAKDGSVQEKLVEGLGLPVDLALDEQGNVWTLDRGSSRLYCHQPDGTQLRELGGQGTGPASLNYPEAVTVRAGLVYVADTRNDRIAVYDTAGTLDRLIAGDFEDPGAIVVTADGAIYLIDKQTGAIEGINQLGGHIFTIEPEDAGQFRGLGLASNGRDLVTLIPGPGDIASYEVQSPDSLPGGVQSNRSLKLPLRAVLYQPRPNPMRDRLIISYGIPGEEKAGLRVYDATGRLCRTLLDGQTKPGWYTVVWDRTDNHGRTVASGVYFVKLETGTGTSERKKVILAR